MKSIELLKTPIIKVAIYARVSTVGKGQDVDLQLRELKKTRENLLAYCKLDTLAMVKILDRLYELCG